MPCVWSKHAQYRLHAKNYFRPAILEVSRPGILKSLIARRQQIKKQCSEIQLLELEAQAKAHSLSSPGKSKPAAIPSLNTVCTGNNAGKSQGQLNDNTRILNPQEWPHLHVPFGLS